MDSLISFVSLTNMPEDPGFATYFSHLLKTKACTDVTFILSTPEGEIEFDAHQLILSMRSYYFADVFYANQKKGEHRIIRLKGISPKAFEDMIRYCYGCKPALENTKEATALFKVANHFKVISLMNLCRTCLRDIEIVPDNVFNMLELAEHVEDNSLKDRCFKLLEEQTREVISSYAIDDVTPVMVHIILDLLKLSLYSEYELIKWLFDWGKVKSEEEDCHCENAREYLQKLLKDMNFLSLTFEEFATLCKDYPDFFKCYEIASIYLNIAFPGVREMPDWYDKDVKIRQYTGTRP